MAQQQAMFFDVITSMKRRTARNDDASDSDDSITEATNRGNKLKRKAKYVQEGHLSQADGPRVYKRKLNYNGYTRNVISKNTARVDPDGDLIEDEEHSDPELSPAEDDPYGDIKLENLLMPLTSAADLDKHPSMSAPYTSKVLDEMVQNVQDMVHREEAALWRVKNQLVQFRGDDAWAPCGMFETENDLLLFQGLRQDAPAEPSVDLDGSKTADEPSNWDTLSNPRVLPGIDEAAEAADLPVAGGEKPDNTDVQDQVAVAEKKAAVTNGVEPASKEEHNSSAREDQGGGPMDMDKAGGGGGGVTTGDASHPAKLLANGDSSHQLGEATQSKVEKEGSVSQAKPDAPSDLNGTAIENAMDIDAPGNDDNSEGAESSMTHRMTTRARAQAAPDPGNSPGTQQDSDVAPAVHPFFLAPPETMPFPTQGLPEQLSNDVRLALSAYVQRQEEVVRQCNTLLDGLRKAQRMKKTVWSWCRNEGHLGEMSDGEDWVDMDEWGLEEPLKKGEEVEDEEVAVGLTKKTRNRRSAA